MSSMTLHDAVHTANSILASTDLETTIILPENQLDPKQRRYYQEELVSSLEDKIDKVNSESAQEQLTELKADVENLDL